MDSFSITIIFAFGLIFAFMNAFGIGANNFANAFANVVGSKTLTLIQACIIAIFTEFLGAVLLGAATVDTIRFKIINVDNFINVPEVLALTFLCALIGSSVWLIIASKFGWPVSTTHSIIGAIAGAGVGAFGANSVVWGWGGIGQLIASWFIAPTFAGIVACLIFLVTKNFVLDNPKAFQQALKAMPIYVFFTFSILLYYIISKAPKGIDLSQRSEKTGRYVNIRKAALVLGLTFGISAFLAIFTYFFLTPFFKRKIEEEEDLKWYHVFYIHWVPKQKRSKFIPVDERKETKVEIGDSTLLTKAQSYLLRGVRMDVAFLQGNTFVKTGHSLAPKYCNKTEYLYSFLQIATSALASFAHGSNDVANSAGPLAVIFTVWKNGQFPGLNTTVPIWILAYGGLAIDLGLFFFGYSVMRNLGNNLTYHSPVRGFCMELGAALTVISASFMGLPVSTTQCILGATVAVGICNGNSKTINWKTVYWTLFSWVLTFPVVGLIAGILNYVLLYSPKLGS